METGTGTPVTQALAPRLAHFASELSRRRVWRTALAYGAVVFVLLQVGEIVFPAFGAPDWALRILVVSCFLGFPVVLCLAWVFDITSSGIRRTLGVEHTGPQVFGPGRAVPRVALLAVTLSIVGGLGWWSLRDTLGTGEATAQPSDPGALLAAEATGEPPVVRSLAVLPLDDFSEEEGGEHFTAGLHEEIVSQLSRSGAARVVSRTSVVQYDRSGKTMPTIARDLGVDAVLEGSVFRAGDRVRITVQLIYGPSDAHLWANSYEGTTEDAIALQRTVAEAISEEIQREIGGGSPDGSPVVKVAEKSRVPEEYRRGRRDEFAGTPEGLASAIRHYEKALESDSSFLPAREGLTTARLKLDLLPGPADSDAHPERRIANARRLAASAHYQEAEGILREVALGAVDAEEAWTTLEQIRTVRGDLQGVVALRLERLSQGISDSLASVAVVDLQTRFQREGEAGFWAWKLEQLQKRSEEGERVSPVELARAHVGIGDLEGAYPHLEAALAERDENLVTLWWDPAWTVLREDPRFRQILTEIRSESAGGGIPFPEHPWPLP